MSRASDFLMRWIWLYLVAYASLVAGAVVALWRGGALDQVPSLYTVLALMLAVGLGVLLAASFHRRPVRD
jgi:hypothetical protein